MALMAIGGLGSLVFGIIILVKAFQTSILWGLGSLFIPFVILIFVFLGYQGAKNSWWFGGIKAACARALLRRNP